MAKPVPVNQILETLFQGYGTQQTRVWADAQKLISRAPGLRLQEDTHISNDGQSELLISFVGAIPIRYKSSQYNIPIQILLPKTYPRQPPICYVRPTSNMDLRQRHQHVDSSGQCYLPYLHAWKESSDLVGLLLELQNIFGADPPVYARPSPPPSTTSPPPTATHPSSHTKPTPPAVISPSRPSVQPPSPATPVSPYQHATQPHPTTPTQPLTSTPPPTHTQLSEKQQLANKIQQRLQALQQATNMDVQKMKEEVERPLLQGQAWLAQAVAGLKADKEKLEEALNVLRQKDEDISNWLSEKENSGISIDEMLLPTDPLSEQMYDLVAEDLAIEDTLYALEGAFTKGALDADTYLRLVRSLSREQFLKRAMAVKVFNMQHPM